MSHPSGFSVGDRVWAHVTFDRIKKIPAVILEMPRGKGKLVKLSCPFAFGRCLAPLNLIEYFGPPEEE